MAALQDVDARVRCSAAEALGGIGAHQAEAVQALVAVLEEEGLDAAYDNDDISMLIEDTVDGGHYDVSVRWRAALALGGVARGGLSPWWTPAPGGVAEPSLGGFGEAATAAMPLAQCGAARAAISHRSHCKTAPKLASHNGVRH